MQHIPEKNCCIFVCKSAFQIFFSQKIKERKIFLKLFFQTPKDLRSLGATIGLKGGQCNEGQAVCQRTALTDIGLSHIKKADDTQ